MPTTDTASRAPSNVSPATRRRFGARIGIAVLAIIVMGGAFALGRVTANGLPERTGEPSLAVQATCRPLRAEDVLGRPEDPNAPARGVEIYVSYQSAFGASEQNARQPALDFAWTEDWLVLQGKTFESGSPSFANLGKGWPTALEAGAAQDRWERARAQEGFRPTAVALLERRNQGSFWIGTLRPQGSPKIAVGFFDIDGSTLTYTVEPKCD